jgi:5-amino-6-(5-phosphoribosylamino)uracil reductase
MQIINVMGASIDGRIASHPNESDAERKRYGFTNEADHAHLRRLLATCDAVIVGGHSVNVSGGVMEVQREDGAYPTWVLCSNSGFAINQPIWSQPNTPKWLVSREALAEKRCPVGVRNVVYGEIGVAKAAVEACKEAGFKRVLLFGGGIINREFYAAGAVDELILTVCPVVVGRSSGIPVVAPELEVPVHLELTQTETEGDLVFLHYLVKR